MAISKIERRAKIKKRVRKSVFGTPEMPRLSIFRSNKEFYAQVIDDVKAAISGLLSPEVREKIIGVARVQDVFRSSKLGSIAGCIVEEGAVKKNNPIRVLRDSVVIYEGQLESLRRFKEDVNEVKSGSECGIGVKDYNDVKANDQIEVYERTEIARTV